MQNANAPVRAIKTMRKLIKKKTMRKWGSNLVIIYERTHIIKVKMKTEKAWAEGLLSRRRTYVKLYRRVYIDSDGPLHPNSQWSTEGQS